MKEMPLLVICVLRNVKDPGALSPAQPLSTPSSGDIPLVFSPLSPMLTQGPRSEQAVVWPSRPSKSRGQWPENIQRLHKGVRLRREAAQDATEGRSPVRRGKRGPLKRETDVAGPKGGGGGWKSIVRSCGGRKPGLGGISPQALVSAIN